ncbi:MAG: oxidoreductase [Armatimonadota bacterium]
MSELTCISRRDFLKLSAGAVIGGMATGLPLHAYVHAQGSDRLRVGLIGCGGRGSGAARDAVFADKGVEIYALGDIFPDRLEACKGLLEPLGKEMFNVSNDRCFTGIDAYKGVIASGVDIVILATPPAFRPIHFQAAVEAGKHVFMEKPVAVCPAGVRLMFQMGEVATQKRLSVVAGTQRRHDFAYRETIRRLHAGAIGKIVAGYCYWNQGGLWHVERQPGWTDAEWQLRNWLYFTWLSGDHIVEQHVHNIDVINWVLQAHPIKAMGLGGRQVRTEPVYGHIYDHFTVEYEYPEGVRVISMCRQIDGCANRIGEWVVGTKGSADPSGTIFAESEWRYAGEKRNPYLQEHVHLIQSIRKSEPLNETRAVTESTLSAIMGRMSAYTGKEVTWEQALNSKESYLERAQNFQFGPMAVDPVPQPGKTPLA